MPRKKATPPQTDAASPPAAEQEKSTARVPVTDDVVKHVEDALHAGGSITRALEVIGVPLRTWYDAMDAHPDWKKRIRRAQNRGHHTLFDGLADEARAIKDSESATAAKAKGYLIEMRAKRMAPHLYSDRVRQEHTGKNGGAIAVKEVPMTPEERQKAIAAKCRELGLKIPFEN